jgi:hypothetical protein
MPPLRRPAPVACLLVALVATGAPAAHAAKSKPRQTACQRLKANNHDESRDRRLVLVTRGDDEFGTIYACVLPRGKVRRLARWDDGLGRDGYAVRATAGSWVLVANSYGDQYGGVSASLTRFDVRSGRSVTLASYGCNVNFDGPCASGTSYGKVVLGPTGAGAIELTDLATRAASLQAFGPAGRLARLDDGPVQTLALTASEIVWTRDGLERRAPLPT